MSTQYQHRNTKQSLCIHENDSNEREKEKIPAEFQNSLLFSRYPSFTHSHIDTRLVVNQYVIIA
jgi:hypothetical protein